MYATQRLSRRRRSILPSLQWRVRLLQRRARPEFRDPPAPELPADGIRNLSWPPSVRYQQGDGNTSGQSNPPTSTPALSSPTTPAVVGQPSQEVYAPLETNQFKLLLLSKGAFDDDIHGTLDTFSLDDRVDFDALSYAWADEAGDDSCRKIIFLGPFWDAFKITANCFAALRRMREVDRDKMVWVDAICIDQGQHAERNHQVDLMARIYSSARELFVYLGEGKRELELAVSKLQWTEEVKTIDPELVRALFQCRYFSRIWIIQEVANARTTVLHYGPKSARWTDLGERRLETIFGPDILSSIPKWVTTIYNQPLHTASDLPGLLFNTIHSEAGDTRDRVFALFGLLQNASSEGLVADYTLAVPEVLTGIAAFVILHLGLRWAPEIAIGKNVQRLPTWIPDWARSRDWACEVRGSQNPRLRISNSGCLSIPAATLFHSDDFALHWTRSDAFRPGHDFSVAGTHIVPLGKIVVFHQESPLFYLEADQTDPSKYQVLGSCQIRLQGLQRLRDEPRDNFCFKHFCLVRLKLERLQHMSTLESHVMAHFQPARQTYPMDQYLQSFRSFRPFSSDDRREKEKEKEKKEHEFWMRLFAPRRLGGLTRHCRTWSSCWSSSMCGGQKHFGAMLLPYLQLTNSKVVYRIRELWSSSRQSFRRTPS